MEIKSSMEKTRAYSRILNVLDRGSFVEIGENIAARLTSFYGPEEVAESDGVITGYGTINGNMVFIYSQDADVMGGTFGEMHGKKIIALYEHALKAKAPIIGLLDSAGFRIEEGLDGLEKFSALYRVQSRAEREIPQIMCVLGNCGGGMAISANMADFVFIEDENGHIYVNPESMIQHEAGEMDYIAAFDDGRYDWDTIVGYVRELVELLPQSSDYIAAHKEVSDEELNRINTGIVGMRGDGRAIITELADEHFFLETQKDKGPDVITGLIRLGGQTVGVACCNTTEEEGSRLSFQGIDKITSTVSICNKFNIPILTITDTEGYQTNALSEMNLPNSAKRLVRELTFAKVPKINLIVGQVFGSAYSMLNSKGLGADYVFIWDNADVSVINSRQAVEMIYGTYNVEMAQKYHDTHSSALALARHGYVDKVIRPEDSRKYLVGAFETFVNSR